MQCRGLTRFWHTHACISLAAKRLALYRLHRESNITNYRRRKVTDEVDPPDELPDISGDIASSFQSVASHLGTPKSPEKIHPRRPAGNKRFPSEGGFREHIFSEHTEPLQLERESAEDRLSRITDQAELETDQSVSENDAMKNEMLMERLRDLENNSSNSVVGAVLRSGTVHSNDDDLDESQILSSANRSSTSRNVTLLRCIRRAGMVGLRFGTELIEKGEVHVNDAKVCDPFHVVTETDVITINGYSGPIRFQAPKLWAFYKPRNMTCTTKGKGDQTTIWNKLAASFGHAHLIPIRPLHYEDRGIILLTNDGELARYISDPSTGMQQTFIVKVIPKIDPLLADKLTNTGIQIDGSVYHNVSIHVAHQGRASSANYVRVCIRGRMPYRIIELMEKLGRKATKVTRLSIGPYSCRDMNPMKIKELALPPNYLKLVNPMWSPFIERDWPYFRERRLFFLRSMSKVRPLSSKERDELDANTMEELLSLISVGSASDATDTSEAAEKVDIVQSDHLPEDIRGLEYEKRLLDDPDSMRQYIQKAPQRTEVPLPPHNVDIFKF
ncbi:tRNA pseudouridine synthase A [Perkinsela sp. CCAP 1560/4]|nr:tRNA pseudouridine synthase A [Perkinsela sp. CCAP 1560/4]KNH05720.1 tRNA pseudouridine synthase A [Perkinsela sp. CCAP 1560/4]|eukprot:KNH05381.1 tRNA pseudouridine synthase A [Perkinsela sp. CCAP 1560/4]